MFGIGSALYWQRDASRTHTAYLATWAIECFILGVWLVVILHLAIVRGCGGTVTLGRFS
jgi:hypothetical protein